MEKYMKKYSNRFLAMLLAGLFMSSQAALADQGRFYVVPGLQWMDFDSERQLEDESGYMFGLGYGLTDRLDLELAYTRQAPDRTDGGRERLRQYRLDLIYGLDNSVGRLTPYFVGGMGDNTFRDTNEYDTFLNFGAGLRYRFNDRFEWRTGARTYFGLDDSTYDFGIDTGLVVRLGSAPEPERVPPTPAPEPEPEIVDSDGDGVPDHLDECPDTPRGYAVDEVGCPIIIEEVAQVEVAVQFEFDRAEVRPEYYGEIREMAQFLEEHPDIVAELEGHTCSIGPEEYNQGLSERRANAVREVLISEFGVSPGRITTTGYGESRPVASNDTREGRERNRRTVSVLSTTVQRPLMEDEVN